MVTETKKTTSPAIQTLNTVLLTIVCGVSMLIFNKVSTIEKNQVEVGKELMRVKTIQDNNTNRITTVENKYENHLIWADLNYVRKQSK